MVLECHTKNAYSLNQHPHPVDPVHILVPAPCHNICVVSNQDGQGPGWQGIRQADHRLGITRHFMENTRKIPGFPWKFQLFTENLA